MYSPNKRAIEHDSGSTFCPGKPFEQFAARWPDSLLCEESRAATRRWARCIPGCRGTIATPQGIAEPATGLPCRGSTAICVLGAPPPNRYIDALMQHEGQACYVGLRKAAELHGATHRAVVEIQVVSTKRLPSIRVGRNRIAFYFHKNIQAMTAGIEDRKTDTGTMKISAAAPTAVDLLRYPHASGEIDNVATTLSDLGKTIDPGATRPPFRSSWSVPLCIVSNISAMTARRGRCWSPFGHEGLAVGRA